MLRIVADPIESINIIIDEIIKELKNPENMEETIRTISLSPSTFKNICRANSGTYYARKMTPFYKDKEYKIAILFLKRIDYPKSKHEQEIKIRFDYKITYISEDGDIFNKSALSDWYEVLVAYPFNDWKKLEYELSVLDIVLMEIDTYIRREIMNINKRANEYVMKQKSNLAKKYKKAWGKFKTDVDLELFVLNLYFDNVKLANTTYLGKFIDPMGRFQRIKFFEYLRGNADIPIKTFLGVSQTHPKELGIIIKKAFELGEKFYKEKGNLIHRGAREMFEETNEKIVKYLQEYKGIIKRTGLDGIKFSAELEKY